MWIALVNGEWQCWRTTGLYSDLVRKDGTVAYLSTITPGAGMSVGTGVASLTVIGGSIYASITGKSPTYAFSRIYRSDDAGATWVLQGTLPSDGLVAGTNVFSDAQFGGCEIVTQADVWCTVHPVWAYFGSDVARQRMGVSTSTNGGVTWTLRLDLGWYLSGGIYGYSGSRNIAKWGGLWYVGGRGNADDGQHYTSPDLVTWTSIGNLNLGGGSGRTFPIATPSGLYSTLNSLSVGGNKAFGFTADPSITVGTVWADLDAFSDLGLGTPAGGGEPLLADLNPNPDEPSKHLWTVSGAGQIRARRKVDPPVVRMLPRDDGRGMSSATRIYPSPAGRSRVVGGYQ